MKKAMSNVDVAAIVEELGNRILGGYVGKAYQVSSDNIWLAVQSLSEGRLNLLLEAGKRAHITRLDRPVSKTPPQFPTMLRRHLSGGRIVDIKQHDFDRILELTVERGGVRNHIVIELFPKGSMALLDESRQILTMLRKLAFQGRKMAAGDVYIDPVGQTDPRTISLKELSELLASSDRDLVRTLVRGLNMSGTYGEEVCLRSRVEKYKLSVELDVGQIYNIHGALKEVFLDETRDPHVILKDGQPMDVLPRPLEIYESLDLKRFATFSEALDAFFREEEVEKQQLNPLDRRIELQRKAIEEFLAQEKELMQKGQLVYQMYQLIEQLLRVVKDARARGFSYSQIWDKIKGSSIPQAQSILAMDGRGEMKIILNEVELELNAGLTVPQNAQRYYEKAKELSRKAAGAKAALAVTEQLRTSKAEPRKIKSQLMRHRKPKWYEKYRWFFSSDGLLIIGGRDAESNEEIYAKYLEKRDMALHTNAPGAPLAIIKTEGEAISETTIQEAAQFAVSYSSIWKGKLGSGDCYLVKGDQVTKTPEHGEFLRRGAFVIRGERRYIKDVPLGLALGISDGILIGGPISAVKPKSEYSLEIEPGEFNADDLAKRIYRFFLERIEDRAYLKSIASVDRIIQFLPSGGSRIKE